MGTRRWPGDTLWGVSTVPQGAVEDEPHLVGVNGGLWAPALDLVTRPPQRYS